MRTSIAVSLLLLPVATAHADAPGMTAPTVGDADTGSYRLQTALCDAAAVSLFAMSAKSDGDAAASIGLAAYFAGVPIVHLIHHHNVRAAESLALRVALPLVVGAIGSAVGKSQCDGAACDNDSDLAGVAYGIIAGAIAASVIDVGYLSRGEDGPATQAAPVVPPPPIGPAEPHQVRVGMTFSF